MTWSMLLIFGGHFFTRRLSTQMKFLGGEFKRKTGFLLKYPLTKHFITITLTEENWSLSTLLTVSSPQCLRSKNILRFRSSLQWLHVILERKRSTQRKSMTCRSWPSILQAMNIFWWNPSGSYNSSHLQNQRSVWQWIE